MITSQGTGFGVCVCHSRAERVRSVRWVQSTIQYLEAVVAKSPSDVMPTRLCLCLCIATEGHQTWAGHQRTAASPQSTLARLDHRGARTSLRAFFQNHSAAASTTPNPHECSSRFAYSTQCVRPRLARLARPNAPTLHGAAESSHLVHRGGLPLSWLPVCQTSSMSASHPAPIRMERSGA